MKINLEWLDNMEKIRFRWNTTHFDMLHYGELFMPEEMGCIYFLLGKPDGQLPYYGRPNNYFKETEGDNC